MMTLEEMQFGALLLTSVLTIDLASRSLRHVGAAYNRSRWLLAGGIGLLAHPEWTNEAVAQDCGFHDRNYFQNMFKHLVGMTPTQYRDGEIINNP